MNGPRLAAVLALAVAVALCGFVGLNLAALFTHGFARASVGDVLWPAAALVVAAAAIRWAIAAWRRPGGPTDPR
jgi:hypothetical protein